MPKHRNLSLKTFVRGVSWDNFQRYFDGLSPDHPPSAWAFLNEEVMEQFLTDPGNAEASGAVLEDFRRINDIAATGMNLLVQAYRQTGVAFAQETPAQELAMRLFLDHPGAFQFAWSRYLYYSTGSKLTMHHLDLPSLEITDEKVERFADDLEGWFSSLAKGNKCYVHCFREDGQTILHIQRGSYLRTVARWKDDQIEIETFRPADEDMLIYNHEDSVLSISAGLAKDREYYLEAFATLLAGEPDLVRDMPTGAIFTLEPLRQGKFDFTGNEEITGVTLVKIRLKLDDLNAPELEIKSRDVMETLKRSLRGLSLSQGHLTAARLQFQVRPENGRTATVSFDIEPPARTNLAQKLYANIIEDYLREQGVKLK